MHRCDIRALAFRRKPGIFQARRRVPCPHSRGLGEGLKPAVAPDPDARVARGHARGHCGCSVCCWWDSSRWNLSFCC
jgi:hypothetical protein